MSTQQTSPSDPADRQQLLADLAAPFDPRDVKWKPQSVKGERALAIAYLDARAIQDRLDAVLGVDCWEDDYTLLPDGSVMCRLTLRICERSITKVDVGSPSEQPDGGDRLKAAFSDALKRAAVKFGIGRYLYRLKMQWVDWDPSKKMFKTTPQLPAFAIPKTKPAAGAGAKIGAAAPKKPSLPANGAELLERLKTKEAELVKAGLCKMNDLIQHVQEVGVKAGFGAYIPGWADPAIPMSVEIVKKFEAKARETPALARLKEAIAEQPTLGDLNTMVEDLENLSPAERETAYKLLDTYAASAGWEWDDAGGIKGDGGYVVTLESTEPADAY